MSNQKDLKYPHSWEERRPAFAQQVLFVPEYYFEHEKYAVPPLFEKEQPLHVEYCSGNGEWIIQKALEHPERNWIAVEMWFMRVRKIWSKMRQAGLKNLVIACGDANDVVRYYLRDQAVDAVYVNFPDPWPKEKHAKHRLIQSAFVKEMRRTLKARAEVTIVTDHEEYSQQIIEEMTGAFQPLFPAPHYMEKEEAYGSSYFNRLWVEKGKFIRFMKFINQG